MKPILRYQSQLLFRRSYKLRRPVRIRPSGRINVVFRPVRRFGAKPQLSIDAGPGTDLPGPQDI